MREVRHAGSAPGTPEIQNHYLAPEHLPVDVLGLRPIEHRFKTKRRCLITAFKRIRRNFLQSLTPSCANRDCQDRQEPSGCSSRRHEASLSIGTDGPPPRWLVFLPPPAILPGQILPGWDQLPWGGSSTSG